jgi:homoserine dehydrogenase
MISKKKKIKHYNLGLLGFGNVNRSFIRHYHTIRDAIRKKYGFVLDLVMVSDAKSYICRKSIQIPRLLEKKKKTSLVGTFCTDPLAKCARAIQESRVDIMIDALPSSKGDVGPTYPLLVNALRRGISVVCVNKAPLVFKGDKLFHLAKKHHTYLGLSGTTAGSLPTAGIVGNELAGSGVYAVRGIVNGTSNYVLDLVGFAKYTLIDAVREAVKLGIAEPDYRFDLNGLDTCFKMIILGLILTGKVVDLHQIPCSGILQIKEEDIRKVVDQGKLIRLIGKLTVDNHEPKIRVGPETIDERDPLFAVRGTGKGIMFKTKYMGDLTMIGGSSGRTHIAAAILKDIISFCKI